jgi:hypothetical protein
MRRWSLLNVGCRSISNVILDVPKDLRGLGLMIVTLGPLDYVTGIRLIRRGGNDKIAGYTSSNRETIFAFAWTAMGGGLRALDQGGQFTQWRESSKFRATCVKSLTVMIDISSNRRSDMLLHTIANRSFVRDIKSLVLQSALIKIRNTELDDRKGHQTRSGTMVSQSPNEESLSPLSDGYQPISWIHFGAYGQSLKHMYRGTISAVLLSPAWFVNYIR